MLGVAAQRIVHAIRKPRNNADGAIAPKPGGTGLSGRSAVSRRSPMGGYHWLRVASCISSREASVATTRDLFRGSLCRVTNGFDIVAVGVENERAVIVHMVVRAQARRAVVL